MDTIIVGIIVAGAVLFIIRSIVRTARGKNACGCCSGCACASGGSCLPPDHAGEQPMKTDGGRYKD